MLRYFFAFYEKVYVLFLRKCGAEKDLNEYKIDEDENLDDAKDVLILCEYEVLFIFALFRVHFLFYRVL